MEFGPARARGSPAAPPASPPPPLPLTLPPSSEPPVRARLRSHIRPAARSPPGPPSRGSRRAHGPRPPLPTRSVPFGAPARRKNPWRTNWSPSAGEDLAGDAPPSEREGRTAQGPQTRRKNKIERRPPSRRLSPPRPGGYRLNNPSGRQTHRAFSPRGPGWTTSQMLKTCPPRLPPAGPPLP